MKYRVLHETEYKYAQSVNIANSRLCLEPKALPARQQVLDTSIRVTPGQPSVTMRTDFFGNRIHYVGIDEPHKKMVVACESTVEVLPAPAWDLEASPPWERIAAGVKAYATPEDIEACAYRFDSPLIHSAPGLDGIASECFPPGRPVLAGARDLTARIYRGFEYDPKATTVATPVEDVLRDRRGVCQDFAHVQILCLRGLGVPVRYVSGYVRTGNVPAADGAGRALVGADASHAWVSVYAGPRTGWVEFDPTNDLMVSDQHVLVAWGRDFSDVSPVKGLVLGGGKHKLTVRVQVEELSNAG